MSMVEPRKMDAFLLLLTFACFFALGSSTIESPEAKLTASITPINSGTYADKAKDLLTSASDRISLVPAFHISKDYGQPGGYAGSYPYGNYYGSIYDSTRGYRGSSLSSGYPNLGYSVGTPGGIVGGGLIGYGYYGNVGYTPSYGGYGGSGGYGGNGIYNGYEGYGGYGGSGGYGGYGGSGGYGGYGGYGNGVGSYGGYGGNYGYGRYGGSDYGYGYNGYGGSNYGSAYSSRNTYDPYGYRGNNYGNYGTNYPSGYRGYS
ncbi:shematrin-like protein 1 isoform X3 [Colletes gigas]|uniref:shematrin-like protein 1 isoform X3 n=1 Tax=Colletes gigas TaxID=935657 RepID=UPI001C9BA736|nr:shematrin-like protein 1 isoform X3 [Colletes gigas]